jgi:hypothetical protein
MTDLGNLETDLNCVRVLILAYTTDFYINCVRVLILAYTTDFYINRVTFPHISPSTDLICIVYTPYW